MSLTVTFVLESTKDWSGDGPGQQSTAPISDPSESSSGIRCERVPEGIVEDGHHTHQKQHALAGSPTPHELSDHSVLSLREASLMRCFIQKIAPWVSTFRLFPND